MKIIDTIVPEPEGGAHQDPEDSASTLERALVRAVARVQGVALGRLLKRRHKRFRNKGEYTTYYQQFLTREVKTLEGYEVEDERREASKHPAETRGETKILMFPGVKEDVDGSTPQSADTGPDPQGNTH